MKFVADSMLGRLAKWLRILGYDAHYQSYYRPGVIDSLMKEDRCLLSRHKETVEQYTNALLIKSHSVITCLKRISYAFIYYCCSF